MAWYEYENYPRTKNLLDIALIVFNFLILGSINAQVVSLPIIDSLSPRPAYLPLSIPEDLSARITRIHGDPIVWWVGQFLKYLLRPQPNIKQMLGEYEEKLGFKKPIVG